MKYDGPNIGSNKVNIKRHTYYHLLQCNDTPFTHNLFIQWLLFFLCHNTKLKTHTAFLCGSDALPFSPQVFGCLFSIWVFISANNVSIYSHTHFQPWVSNHTVMFSTEIMSFALLILSHSFPLQCGLYTFTSESISHNTNTKNVSDRSTGQCGFCLIPLL